MTNIRALVFAVAVMSASSSAYAVQPDEIMADPAKEARARELSRELRCMVCQNQSIDDSEAPLARDLRLLVRERIAAGDSDAQVLDFLVARYGEFVLLKPRLNSHTWLLWFLTPLALSAGGIALWIQGRRRAKASADQDPALLHLTPGLDGVSRAANECERGLLPDVPTICVGQPTAFDPSRAPDGKAILWLQLPEAPRHIKGDAAAHLPVPADGKWTEELRERFADRVERILESHIDGWSENVIARKAYSPVDLEKMNMNLVGGDPYGGFCGVDQFFVWRPFKSSVNHKTHVPGLYHIGASTHPGPGLGGGSGFLLASSLK